MKLYIRSRIIIDYSELPLSHINSLSHAGTILYIQCIGQQLINVRNKSLGQKLHLMLMHERICHNNIYQAYAQVVKTHEENNSFLRP